MKQQHPAIIKPAPKLPAESKRAAAFSVETGEFDMLRGFYLEKLQELNHQLQGLNLMENAREISTTCLEIIRAKKILNGLNLKRGYQA